MGSHTRIKRCAAVTKMLDLVSIPLLGHFRRQANNSVLMQSSYCLGDVHLGLNESDETLNTTHPGNTREYGILRSSEGRTRKLERVIFQSNMKLNVDIRFNICTHFNHYNFSGEIIKFQLYSNSNCMYIYLHTYLHLNVT